MSDFNSVNKEKRELARQEGLALSERLDFSSGASIKEGMTFLNDITRDLKTNYGTFNIDSSLLDRVVIDEKSNISKNRKQIQGMLIEHSIEKNFHQNGLYRFARNLPVVGQMVLKGTKKYKNYRAKVQTHRSVLEDLKNSLDFELQQKHEDIEELYLATDKIREYLSESELALEKLIAYRGGIESKISGLNEHLKKVEKHLKTHGKSMSDEEKRDAESEIKHISEMISLIEQRLLVTAIEQEKNLMSLIETNGYNLKAYEMLAGTSSEQVKSLERFSDSVLPSIESSLIMSSVMEGQKRTVDLLTDTAALNDAFYKNLGSNMKHLQAGTQKIKMLESISPETSLKLMRDMQDLDKQQQEFESKYIGYLQKQRDDKAKILELQNKMFDSNKDMKLIEGLQEVDLLLESKVKLNKDQSNKSELNESNNTNDVSQEG